MPCRCKLIEGEPCPHSMENYEECPFYDPDGDWCYYNEPIRKVG
jgi:hypothetical protein